MSLEIFRSRISQAAPNWAASVFTKIAPKREEVFAFLLLLIVLFPMDNSIFWVALGVIVNSVIAYAAVHSILEKNRREKALFNHAIQVDVKQDGLLEVHNIFDEPVLVKMISQKMVLGGSVGLQRNAGDGEIKQKLPQLHQILNDKSEWEESPLNKPLVPKLYFIFSGTKTHISGSSSREPVWVVGTKIAFSSISGKRKGTTKFVHRYSSTLVPRDRWVETLLH